MIGSSSLLTDPNTIRYASGAYERNDDAPDVLNAVCMDTAERDCQSRSADFPGFRRSWIDATYTNDTARPKVTDSLSGIACAYRTRSRMESESGRAMGR